MLQKNIIHTINTRESIKKQSCMHKTQFYLITLLLYNLYVTSQNEMNKIIIGSSTCCH